MHPKKKGENMTIGMFGNKFFKNMNVFVSPFFDEKLFFNY